MGVLRFDGVNDVVTIPTSMVVNTGTATWVLEFKFSISSYPVSSNRYFTGVPTGTTNSGFCLRQLSGNGALALVVSGSNVAGFTSPTGYILDDSTVHTYRVERDGGADIRFYRDGSLISTVSWVTSTSFGLTIGRFGSGSTATSGITAFDLEYFDFVSGFSNLEKWDANLSGGTGSVLPTVSGTNQGTLVNFPTNGTQWIGFGGAGAVLESNAVSSSVVTSVLSTGIQLACSVQSVSTTTSNLTTGIPLSSSGVGFSSITAELTDSSSGLAGGIYSTSSMSASLSTSIRFSATCSSSSTMLGTLYEPPPDVEDTLQNKKLILLQDAGDAYPDNTINDAMDTYLEVRYSVDQGLSDMIARYLGE